MNSFRSRVAWVVCHFNNAIEVRAFITAVRDKHNASSVYIVDNSGGFQIDVDEKAFVLHSKSNLFYFGAFAMALTKIPISEYDWIIFSNTDLDFAKSVDLSCVLASFPTGFGCWSPRVVDSRGRVQNPHLKRRLSKRFLAWRRFVCSTRFYWWVFHFVRNSYLLLLSAHSKSQQAPPNGEYTTLYAPHGSIFALRTSTLTSSNPFVWGARMFNEEAQLGEWLAANSISAACDNTVNVLHAHHSVTSAIPSDSKRRLYYESYDFLLRTHYL